MKLIKNFARLAFYVFVLSNFSACVTYPPSTGYVAAEREAAPGYSVIEAKAGNIALYHGNTQTLSSDAYAYTLITAIEYCQNKNLVIESQSHVGFVETE